MPKLLRSPLTVGVVVSIPLMAAVLLVALRADASTVGDQAELNGEIIGLAAPLVIPLEGPIVVAIQPGHWKIDELPAELTRRERGIGAVYGEVREMDINLAVVAALVPKLEAENWTVIVVPATVPPGLRADAFISIHADWAGDPGRRGWKLAPPWRPSPASTELADALKASFRAEEGLKEDIGGITTGMRGYFGFSSHRYVHASSPYTPAVLIELGFVTNAGERRTMVSDPGYYAGVIHRGLERLFYTRGRSDAMALIPRVFSSVAVGAAGASVYLTPHSTSEMIRQLEPGVILRPVDKTDGWHEVLFFRPFGTGWIADDDLVRPGVIASSEP